MRVALLTLGLLAVTAPLSAQVMGDSLRLRVQRGDPWVFGKVTRADSSAFTLRHDTEDRDYRPSEVFRIDRWKRKKLALDVFACMLGAVAGWGAAELTSERVRNSTMTGSDGGDIAFALGLGAVIGVIGHSIEPGSWHRIRR